jgi:hypothetical protein
MLSSLRNQKSECSLVEEIRDFLRGPEEEDDDNDDHS